MLMLYLRRAADYYNHNMSELTDHQVHRICAALDQFPVFEICSMEQIFANDLEDDVVVDTDFEAKPITEADFLQIEGGAISDLEDDGLWIELHYPGLRAFGEHRYGVNAVISPDLETGELICDVGYLQVPEGARGYGLGKKLTYELLYRCGEMGVVELRSEILNPIVLAMRREIFGEDALSILDMDSGGRIELTYEEAMEQLRSEEGSVYVKVRLID